VVKAGYRPLTGIDDAFATVRRVQARAVVVDVEPLVAAWGTDQDVLIAGLDAVVERIAADPGELRVVVFATNSPRRPAVVPQIPGLEVRYVAMARKPLRLDPFRGLPPPVVMIGDQIATDGLLAWRLGFLFLHYTLDRAAVPAGPRLMGALGWPLRRLLFHDV